MRFNTVKRPMPFNRTRLNLIVMDGRQWYLAQPNGAHCSYMRRAASMVPRMGCKYGWPGPGGACWRSSSRRRFTDARLQVWMARSRRRLLQHSRGSAPLSGRNNCDSPGVLRKLGKWEKWGKRGSIPTPPTSPLSPLFPLSPLPQLTEHPVESQLLRPHKGGAPSWGPFLALLSCFVAASAAGASPSILAALHP